jgi:Ser/Thr protein kinase RdoA (MazF antagonist)
MNDPSAARSAAAEFALPGPVQDVQRLTGGHIHESYRATCACGGGSERFLIQRINTSIFGRPETVIGNILRVTRWQRARLVGERAADVDRRVLTLMPRGGAVAPSDEPSAFLATDERGGRWRVFRWIERTRSPLVVRGPDDAESAGRAFGAFQRGLADYGGPRLHETLPHFHDTPRRLAALAATVARDPCGRAREVRAERDFIAAREALAGVLPALERGGLIPERIVHNDAKLSNVLFDEQTGAALCVVDLDTVMPGLSLYDFGDMARTMTSAAAEDEADAAKVRAESELFAALVRGYLAEAGAFLRPVERAHLVTAAKLITYEQAVRFLADYVAGDAYYATSRARQNLDRARAQLALLESMEGLEREWGRIVERLRGTARG